MTKAKESKVGIASSWLTLVASFFLSFATWVAIGEIAGFEGSWDGDQIWTTLPLFQLAWALPLCVDGYVVSGLVTWMAPVDDQIAKVAKWNTYGGAAVGIIAQAGYHGWSAYDKEKGGFLVALSVLVGTLPPALSAGAVHLRAMVKRRLRVLEHALAEHTVSSATVVEHTVVEQGVRAPVDLEHVIAEHVLGAPTVVEHTLAEHEGGVLEHPVGPDELGAPRIAEHAVVEHEDIPAPRILEHEWEQPWPSAVRSSHPPADPPAPPVMDWTALEEHLAQQRGAQPQPPEQHHEDEVGCAPTVVEHAVSSDELGAPNIVEHVIGPTAVVEHNIVEHTLPLLEHTVVEHPVGHTGVGAPRTVEHVVGEPGVGAPRVGAPRIGQTEVPARDKIKALMAKGHGPEAVAELLGMHKKTVARYVREIEKEKGAQ